MDKKQYNKIRKYKKKRIGIITTKSIILLVVILAVFISVGYSYWNTTLKINGTVTAFGEFFTNYYINYDLDGGQFYETPISQYNENTETFDLPTPVKSGYKFLGWTDGTTESEEVLQNSIKLTLNQSYKAGTQNSNTIYIKGTKGEVFASFVTYDGKPRCMVYVFDKDNSEAQFSTNGNSWSTISNWLTTTTKDNVDIYYQFFTLSAGGQNTASGIPTYNGSFDDFTAAIIETEKYVYKNPWTVEQGSKGNIDVIAVWEEATTYTITFNSNTGTGTMPTQIIVSGETENLLENKFKKTEYAFAGWATSSNGAVIYDDMQSITPNSNLELYAKWTKPVIVSFNSNGGTGTMTDQEFLEGEAQKIKENTFTKTGEFFIGWATSSNGFVVYTDGQEITINENMELFAVWDNTCYVSFKSNGGTGTMNDQSFAYGESKNLTSNTFTRTNYVFRGWATSSTATTAEYDDSEQITPTSNMTLYAVWKRTYTVTFNANNGTGTMPTQTFVEGETQKLNTNVYTRNNYVFRGWATTANATSATYQDKEKIAVTENRTLYAFWKRTYTVTFNANNGTGTMESQTFVAGEEQAINANQFTRNGYTFKGWGTRANSRNATYTDGQTITLTQNRNLYALWTRN